MSAELLQKLGTMSFVINSDDTPTSLFDSSVCLSPSLLIDRANNKNTQPLFKSTHSILNKEDDKLHNDSTASPRPRPPSPPPRLEQSKVRVVIPSLTSDPDVLDKITGIVHYEERQLWNLFALPTQPGLQLVYVSSMPIDPAIMDYYLSLSEKIPAPFLLNQQQNMDLSGPGVRERVHWVAVHDPAKIPLTQKLLASPQIMEDIRKLAQKLNRSEAVETEDEEEKDDGEGNNGASELDTEEDSDTEIGTDSQDDSLSQEAEADSLSPSKASFPGHTINNIDECQETTGTQPNNWPENVFSSRRRSPRVVSTTSGTGRDRGGVEMFCFISSRLEGRLARKIRALNLGCPPKAEPWGTKRGSRALFAAAAVPHPRGTTRLARSAPQLARDILRVWQEWPALQVLVIKLNEGFSGEGNALLSLESIKPRLVQHSSAEQERVILQALPEGLQFQTDLETWPSFLIKIGQLGCIVEEFILGEGKRSPSVQVMIHPLSGQVEVLSAHEQILGGPHGQIYWGCQFPCLPAYHRKLRRLGHIVGEKLQSLGAHDRFSVDFLAVPPQNPNRNSSASLDVASSNYCRTNCEKETTENPERESWLSGQKSSSVCPADVEEEEEESGGWQIFALEINLRAGGTTHPFETLRLLTGGQYEEETGLFVTPWEQEKFYLATDNLQSPAFVGMKPELMLQWLQENYPELLYQQTRRSSSNENEEKSVDRVWQKGCVFHLLGSLFEFGKMGVTCIADSAEEAEEMLKKLTSVLESAVFHKRKELD